jgi:SAM-dependent methyltransferase
MSAESDPQPRGLVFGAIADQYDEYRPGYPTAVLDDVLTLLPGPRVVEVGGGTGKATVELVARGLRVTVVEPDPRMAAILAVRCPEADLRISTFEAAGLTELTGRAERYDGLLSAQAWHWTDPATRLDRAADLLRPGGLVALWWNRNLRGAEPVYEAIDAAYAANGLEPADRPDANAETPEPWAADELRAHPAFGDVDVRGYAWRQEYTAARYSALLETTSHHQVLPPAVRQALSAAITAAVETAGGRLRVERRTDLYLARRAAE